METVSDIIAAFGSAADLARSLDIPTVTPRAWRRRGSIPVDYWDLILVEAQKRGLAISVETLYRVSCTRKPTKDAA